MFIGVYIYMVAGVHIYRQNRTRVIRANALFSATKGKSSTRGLYRVEIPTRRIGGRVI